MKNSESSRVYKITFANGDTFYGRMTSANKCSAKAYLNGLGKRLERNSKNPIRSSMTTAVEKRIAAEFDTTTCEIVFEGPTAEAISVKDTLSLNDSKSLNIRTNVIVGEAKDTIKVPIKHSKTLRNAAGEIINYVFQNYARIHNLVQYMDETKRHPVDKSYFQILVPIERY